MKISGAIFDLDGTLLDSMHVWDGVGAQYLRARGVTPRPGLQRTLHTMSLRQAADYLIAEYGLHEPAQAVMDGVNALVERQYRETVLLKSGVREMLGGLHSRGVRLCAATATDRPLAEACLRRCGVLPLFSGVFTCGEVGAGKDRPDIFLAALRRLATDKGETPVFEDSLHAARTAKSAGFPLVAVYDQTSAGQWGELRRIADYSLQDWADWEGMLA